jgi:hypothetical protein
LASHSLSRGHFFFVRLSVQSPHIVISGLHGTKPSGPGLFDAFFIFALRAFAMLVTFDMILLQVNPHGVHSRIRTPQSEMINPADNSELLW